MTSTAGLIGNFGQVTYGAAKLGIAGLSKCIALDMSRFGGRSNCISPFAWSRLIGTIPIADEAQAARVEKIKPLLSRALIRDAAFIASVPLLRWRRRQPDLRVERVPVVSGNDGFMLGVAGLAQAFDQDVVVRVVEERHR